MIRVIILGSVLGLSAVAPAYAFSTEAAPRNADGSSSLTDPDEALEAQAEAYKNGDGVRSFWGFGNGATSGASSERGNNAPLYRAHRDRNDHSCIQCESDLVDGVWVLRSQRAQDEKKN